MLAALSLNHRFIKAGFTKGPLRLPMNLIKDVAMRVHFRITALASLMIAVFVGPHAFAAEDYMPPQTDFGVPDVQGVWNYKTRTSLQRSDVY